MNTLHKFVLLMVAMLAMLVSNSVLAQGATQNTSVNADLEGSFFQSIPQKPAEHATRIKRLAVPEIPGDPVPVEQDRDDYIYVPQSVWLYATSASRLQELRNAFYRLNGGRPKLKIISDSVVSVPSGDVNFPAGGYFAFITVK